MDHSQQIDPARTLPAGPKTTLPELLNYFAGSAGNHSLSKAERALAAQMCILVGHVQQQGRRVGFLGKVLQGLDKAVAVLIKRVLPGPEAETAAPEAPAAPAAQTQPPADATGTGDPEMDAALAMAEQVAREADEEASAVQTEARPEAPALPAPAQSQAPRRAKPRPAGPNGSAT